MAKEKVTRRLAAIFAADMVGYSRLMEADEEGTIARLKANRKELIDPKIAQHDGRIVKTTGDGMLVEFASVVDAVRCAVEVQNAMAEREANVPDDRRIRYRVGVNLGDIVIEGDDIFGDGVNVAARLEALAEPGEVLISGTAFDHLKKKLAYGYRLQGERKVKNIAEPVRIYSVLPHSEAGTVFGQQRWSPNIWRWVAGAIATVLLLFVAVAAWWRPWVLTPTPASTAGKALPLPEEPSIAVLPFGNLGGDKKQEDFAAGMTEDLITDLAKVSGLFVINSGSILVYKGKEAVDVRKIGRKLGVRYVVKGSVRQVGGKIRINAQLVEATTRRQLWAERYDGESKDIFILQDRVTQRIIKALAVRLKAGEATLLSMRETKNVTAYNAYLRGWKHYQRFSRGDYHRAVALFERAVELDPDYARAYAALALAHWTARRRYWIPRRRIEQALFKEPLRLALRRPTSLAYRLASLIALRHRRHGEAVAQAERALAIEPNNAESHIAMANAMVFSGDPQGALPYARKAMRLNPHYPANYLRVLGLAQFGMDNFKKAAALFERASKRNPKDELTSAALVAVYGHLGRKAEAVTAMKTYLPATLGTLQQNPVTVMIRWPFREPSDAERFGVGLLKAGICCRRDLDSLLSSLRARKLKPKE